MASILNRLLTLIDVFGVPVQMKTSQKHSTFRTWVGGLLTLIIYSASLIYTIYILAEWQTGSLLPRISNQIQASDFLNLEFRDSVLLEVDQFDFGVNPFDTNNVIFVPLLYEETVINGKYFSSQVRPLLPNKLKIEVNNITLKTDPAQEHFSKMFFVRCEPRHLSEGQRCAAEKTIEDFLATFRTYFKVRIFLKQFNPTLNRFTEFYKDLYLMLEPEYSILNTISFSTTLVSHDQGILLPSISEHLILSDFSTNTQVVTKQFLKNLIPENYTPFATINFSLDKLQNLQTIVRPKIGEIFADIGSIVSILMMIKCIAECISSKWQEETLIDIILKAYFKQYEEVKLSKGLFGKIKRVEWKSKSLDAKKFELNLKSVKSDLSSYLEFSRIIQKLILIEKKLQLVSFHLTKEEKVTLMTPKSKHRKGSSRENEEDEIVVQDADIDIEIEQIFTSDHNTNLPQIQKS